VKVVNVEDHTLYRVQLGGYRLRDDAQELANDLSAEGYSPTVINDRN
jgi:cell division protein FtsN